MKRCLLLGLLALCMLPVNSWAIAKIKYDIYSPGGGYSVVHGDTYIGNLSGTLTGYWDDSIGKFSGIKGWLNGDYGRVDFVGGQLNFNGRGSLYGAVHKDGSYADKDYIGGFHFRDAGWYGGHYDNVVTSDYLKIWGAGYFLKFITPYYSDYPYFAGWKKLGIDLYGHGTKVSEPTTFVLLLMGLISVGAVRVFKRPSKSIWRLGVV